MSLAQSRHVVLALFKVTLEEIVDLHEEIRRLAADELAVIGRAFQIADPPLLITIGEEDHHRFHVRILLRHGGGKVVIDTLAEGEIGILRIAVRNAEDVIHRP